MPKQKTHSGAKKRFKLTGSGKVKRQQANRRHYLEHKSSRLTRRLASDQIVTGGQAKVVKKSWVSKQRLLSAPGAPIVVRTD